MYGLFASRKSKGAETERPVSTRQRNSTGQRSTDAIKRDASNEAEVPR